MFGHAIKLCGKDLGSAISTWEDRADIRNVFMNLDTPDQLCAKKGFINEGGGAGSSPPCGKMKDCNPSSKEANLGPSGWRWQGLR